MFVECCKGSCLANVEDKKINLLICKKCKKRSTFKIRDSECFCKPCFKLDMLRNFRKGFGQHNQSLYNVKSMLAISGRQNSIFLLNLIIDIKMNHDTRKFMPHVVYICDKQFYPDYLNFKDINIESELKLICAKHNIPFTSFNMENFFNVDILSNFYCQYNEMENRDKSFIHKKIIRKLLTCIYHHLKMDQLLIASNQLNLTIDIFEKMSSATLNNFNSSDFMVSNSNCKILLPLRLFNSKEITLFNHYCGIKPFHNFDFYTKEPITNSTTKCTENLFISLLSSHPGSNNTVFRISEKMNMKSYQNCSLCGMEVCKSQSLTFYNNILTKMETLKDENEATVSKQANVTYFIPILVLSSGHNGFALNDYCQSCTKMMKLAPEMTKILNEEIVLDKYISVQI
ncbi:hypothetical protein A3Q56_00070 [Intoshia linei]|uniref:Cytoplasmic tRNA 2-thiolation protein 2 n=1 Tax=Intoshia linei TaxID=1819745 RepID=A0A177BCV7_9BILA|nr:hypothetical protein A3Q56_00070 [Intoshia linei]